MLAANGFGGPRASFLWPSAFVAPSLVLRLEPCAEPALQGSDAARDADGKHEEEPDLAELCEHLSLLAETRRGMGVDLPVQKVNS